MECCLVTVPGWLVWLPGAEVTWHGAENRVPRAGEVEEVLAEESTDPTAAPAGRLTQHIPDIGSSRSNIPVLRNH